MGFPVQESFPNLFGFPTNRVSKLADERTRPGATGMNRPYAFGLRLGRYPRSRNLRSARAARRETAGIATGRSGTAFRLNAAGDLLRSIPCHRGWTGPACRRAFERAPLAVHDSRPTSPRMHDQSTGKGFKVRATYSVGGSSLSGSLPRGPGTGNAPTLDLGQNPVVSRVRGLCDAGKLDAAILLAFDRVFADTVRAYGLDIPPGCTSLEFVSSRLRTDMGKLCDLLPELYRLYEPVRFGGVAPADPQAIRGLVERIYTETALAWVYDPRSQPRGPVDRAFADTFSVSRATTSGAPRRS